MITIYYFTEQSAFVKKSNIYCHIINYYPIVVVQRYELYVALEAQAIFQSSLSTGRSEKHPLILNLSIPKPNNIFK